MSYEPYSRADGNTIVGRIVFECKHALGFDRHAERY